MYDVGCHPLIYIYLSFDADFRNDWKLFARDETFSYQIDNEPIKTLLVTANQVSS